MRIIKKFFGVVIGGAVAFGFLSLIGINVVQKLDVFIQRNLGVNFRLTSYLPNFSEWMPIGFPQTKEFKLIVVAILMLVSMDIFFKIIGFKNSRKSY